MYICNLILIVWFFEINFRIIVFNMSNFASNANKFDVITIVFDLFAFDYFVLIERIICVEISIKFDAW